MAADGTQQDRPLPFQARQPVTTAAEGPRDMQAGDARQPCRHPVPRGGRHRGWRIGDGQADRGGEPGGQGQCVRSRVRIADGVEQHVIGFGQAAVGIVEPVQHEDRRGAEPGPVDDEAGRRVGGAGRGEDADMHGRRARGSGWPGSGPRHGPACRHAVPEFMCARRVTHREQGVAEQGEQVGVGVVQADGAAVAAGARPRGFPSTAPCPPAWPRRVAAPGPVRSPAATPPCPWRGTPEQTAHPPGRGANGPGPARGARLRPKRPRHRRYGPVHARPGRGGRRCRDPECPVARLASARERLGGAPLRRAGPFRDGSGAAASGPARVTASSS